MNLKDTIEVTESEVSSKFAITVKRGDFAGVTYQIGAVEFPEGDEPIMRFDYEIVSGEVADKKAFEQFIGDSIVEMITEQLKSGTLVFAGGS